MVLASSVFAASSLTFHFDIPRQRADGALISLGKQADVTVLYQYDLVKQYNTNSLLGEYTLEKAVSILLQGSGLAADFNADGRLIITKDNNFDGVNQVKTTAKKSLFTTFMSLFLSAGGTGQGVAQTQEEFSGFLEEVVVTATKRSKNLQDVAFGLSAQTEDSLNRIGAIGAEDYLATVPGVTYNSLGRGRSPIIFRGVATISTSILSDAQSTSAIYIDDLPSLQRWGAWTNTDPNTFDVERVEVLRGPQGTLFGSGALGGAVRVINNKPDVAAFAASVELDYSSVKDGDDSNSISGMLNIPLIEDELALRLVAYTRDDGGYIDNTVRNEKNVNSGETNGARFMLAWNATDNLDLRLTVTHQADEVDDSSATFADKADGERYEYNGILPEFSDVSISVYNLTAEYDFGSVLLTSSTTSSERESFINLDFVSITDVIFGTGLDPNETDYSLDEEVETVAQELRLSSQGNGSLEWTVGLFFFEQEIETAELWTADNLLPDGLAGQSLYLPNIKERAIFGEASYNLSDQLSITAGGRWFDNTFEMEIPVANGALSAGLLPLTKENSSSFTPKVSVSYHPTDEIHLYATAAEGFRIGQVNIGVSPGNGVPLTYEPDSLWNYEVGMKSLLLDGRLKLNLAAFYIDWTNIQLQRTVVLSSGQILNFNDNAGDAISQGIEAEMTYVPIDGWELGSALTYNEAELDSAEPDTGLTSGSDLPGTPKLSLSNYIQYSMDNLLNGMSGYVRLGHNHVGEMVSNIVNTDSIYSDTYNVFNLRAGIYLNDYEVALYVENLGNNDAATSKYDPDLFNVFNARAYRLKPRTMGLTFRARF